MHTAYKPHMLDSAIQMLSGCARLQLCAVCIAAAQASTLLADKARTNLVLGLLDPGVLKDEATLGLHRLGQALQVPADIGMSVRHQHQGSQGQAEVQAHLTGSRFAQPGNLMAVLMPPTLASPPACRLSVNWQP